MRSEIKMGQFTLLIGLLTELKLADAGLRLDRHEAGAENKKIALVNAKGNQNGSIHTIDWLTDEKARTRSLIGFLKV